MKINSYIASLMCFAEVSSVGRAADIRTGCCCQFVGIQCEAHMAWWRRHHSPRTHSWHRSCVLHQRRLTPPRGAKNRYAVMWMSITQKAIKNTVMDIFYRIMFGFLTMGCDLCLQLRSLVVLHVIVQRYLNLPLWALFRRVGLCLWRSAAC